MIYGMIQVTYTTPFKTIQREIPSLISSYFFLSCKTLDCESALEISNKLLISTRKTLAFVADFKNKDKISLEILPSLKFPLEYLLHNSQISSYAN